MPEPDPLNQDQEARLILVSELIKHSIPEDSDYILVLFDRHPDKTGVVTSSAASNIVGKPEVVAKLLHEVADAIDSHPQAFKKLPLQEQENQEERDSDRL